MPNQIPQIHGPRVVGTTPGRPFLFLIPVSGTRPLTFRAEHLPDGLKLNTTSGIISGSISQERTFHVLVSVENEMGKSVRTLNIVAGTHKLALTPPMGWNSWNIWAATISDQKVRDAADWMVKSGLAEHGYQYINMDDGWEGSRCPKERIRPNDRFPDMRKLADYVHEKGLKFGIYSSPGPKTCQGLEGSLNHEQTDAKTYAEWGVDYLKYDWCSYEGVFKKPKIRWPHFFNQGHFFIHMSIPLQELKNPYLKMRAALDTIPRDILYSLVPMTLNGKLNPSAWGKDVGANCWRTSGDIMDTWQSIASIGFPHSKMGMNIGPGRWNDPDMLCVGTLGLAWGKDIRPSRLTTEEQRSHISLWCLLAAPLLIGCDLSKLDPLTLELLTNDEMIDIDQDPLGRPAQRVLKQGSVEVWTRSLWNGTVVVGLFNRSDSERIVTLEWEKIEIHNANEIRDLWTHKDIENTTGNYSRSLLPHGCAILRVGKSVQSDFILN